MYSLQNPKIVKGKSESKFGYSNAQLTWNRPVKTVWKHSICKLRKEGYQRMSCSSCMIFLDGWFPFVLFQSLAHPILDQIPVVGDEKRKLRFYFS